jgi:hypothetical protein
LLEKYEQHPDSDLLRSYVYEQYETFCKDNNIESTNTSGFGKLIHATFPNIKSRRLGIRGRSKYHYIGLREKSSVALTNTITGINSINTINSITGINGINSINLSNDPIKHQLQSTKQQLQLQLQPLQQQKQHEVERHTKKRKITRKTTRNSSVVEAKVEDNNSMYDHRSINLIDRVIYRRS